MPKSNYLENIRLEYSARFLALSKATHKNIYNYDKVEYRSRRDKVEIVCSKHGSFWKFPKAHERGEGCPYCINRHLKNTKLIIQEFKEVHGEKYNYSKVEYVKSHVPVEIICKTHGSFLQLPVEHKRGKGCLKCAYVIRGETLSKRLLEKKMATFLQ